MSFSYDAKFEVAESEIPQNKCCCIAELAGLLRTCAQIEFQEIYKIEFITELKNLPKRISFLLKNLYQKEILLDVSEEEKPNHTIKYHILVPTDITEQLLTDTYMLRQNYSGQKEIYFGVTRHLIEQDCCQREFIKGVFMGCASANIVIKDINDLKKHTGGYHLEFVFSNHSLAGDFSHILSQYEIYSKSMQRKKFSVIYIKEAEIVSDTLALVGANNAVLTLQNEFAVREVRNKLNRQLNCMNSNMGKMVEASLKQIDAIEYISQNLGLENLPDNLYELCMLRLANPEETLDNLAKLMNPPLTKSGVNHRLRKIVKIAEELKLKNEQDNQEINQE
ncbi:MAG: DNA-binding protein WhiA [Clostridia bacterium]|nr:DNA-binding protein WhiA [Clostridia bacterium]